jgi:hypothetical protein
MGIDLGVTDRLLPSKEEGRLLVKKLNNTKVEVLELQDSSHYFLDGSIDLEKVISVRELISYHLNILLFI